MVVILGRRGDLAQRMLYPSLDFLDADGLLGPEVRIVGAARSELSREVFVERACQCARGAARLSTKRSGARFAERLDYRAANVSDPDGLAPLAELVQGLQSIFFLAVSPTLFSPICRALAVAGLACEDCRIVLEKPVGRDLEARARSMRMWRPCSLQREFRIDHYLGKETVQNLIALRFANTLFEPLWNNLTIDHVQISGRNHRRWRSRRLLRRLRRAARHGANHMLQLLCLIAWNPRRTWTLNPSAMKKSKC